MQDRGEVNEHAATLKHLEKEGRLEGEREMEEGGRRIRKRRKMYGKENRGRDSYVAM